MLSTTTQPTECFRGLNDDLVTRILQFLPTAKTELVGGDLGGGRAKWSGGVVADNGSFYCIPFYFDQVLEYNAATNTSTHIGKDPSKYGRHKWRDAVISSDGIVYGLPR